MTLRFHALLVAATVVAAIAATPIFAQSNRWIEPPAISPPGASPPANPPSANSPAPNSPPPISPAQRDRWQNIDFLFEALKVAPDNTTAKAVSDRIWGLWLASGGDTTNVLMTRVRIAIEAKDLDLAIELLNSVIDFKPDYVEGWDQRATVYYMKKDYVRSLADLGQVLKREPRHFGALFGLGIIMQEFGEDKRALEVYRRALAIDPHMERVPELIRTLSEKVEGRDI